MLIERIRLASTFSVSRVRDGTHYIVSNAIQVVDRRSSIVDLARSAFDSFARLYIYICIYTSEINTPFSRGERNVSEGAAGNYAGVRGEGRGERRERRRKPV